MDPIADMLIRIKNAQAVKKESASVGYSNLKWEIAKVLQNCGFLGESVKRGKRGKKLMEINLLYGPEGNPKISGARRISKLSRRVYKGYREIYSVRNGFGTAIYSTPQGLMTDKEARKAKLGGEILFEIW